MSSFRSSSQQEESPEEGEESSLLGLLFDGTGGEAFFWAAGGGGEGELPRPTHNQHNQRLLISENNTRVVRACGQLWWRVQASAAATMISLPPSQATKRAIPCLTRHCALHMVRRTL